jgi:hypothetical protein
MGATGLVTPLKDAVMEVAPFPTALTNPPVVTVAALALLVDQVAVDVMFCVDPSL